jgi:hypothetical protein
MTMEVVSDRAAQGDLFEPLLRRRQSLGAALRRGVL